MSFAAACGIAAMLCWGIADFIQSYPIRRLGTPKTMVIRNVLTFNIGVGIAAVLWANGQLQFDLLSAIVVASSSIMYVLGYFAYMRGFEVGQISLVAPIASSFSVVTVFLTFATGKEPLNISQAASIAIIIIGILLTTIKFRKLQGFWKERGIREALVTFFAFGVAFFLLGFAPGSLQPVEVFTYSAITQAFLFLCLGFRLGGKPDRTDLDRRTISIFLVHTILLNLAWFAYILGGSTGMVSVVTPIASVFSGVTVILATIFLKERIGRGQAIGIATTLAGVFLLSI